jgi:hypothetical protein
MTKNGIGYINPLIYTTLGALSHVENFPIEEQVLNIYSQLSSLTASEIVSLITSDPNYVSYVDIIKNSIDGMSVKSVGFVVTKFIDSKFPSLMDRLNRNEAEFDLYRDVIISLVDEIQKSG